MHRISAHWLSKFKPASKQYKEAAHNLNVVVNPTGLVSIAFYHKSDGVQHRQKLGSYRGKPDKETIDSLNQQYQKLVLDLAQGVDVWAEREFDAGQPSLEELADTAFPPLEGEALAIVQQQTFRHICRLYWIDFSSSGKKSASNEGSLLRKLVDGFGSAKGLGDMMPDQIKAPHVQVILDAVRQKHPTTANGVKRLCSRLWRWMKRRGWVESRESILDLDAPAPPERDRLFTESEMTKLVRGCHPYLLAIAFNPLRLAEHCQIHWDQIDADLNATVVVKGGRKHIQPLSEDYLACGRATREQGGWLFTGRHGNGHILRTSLSDMGTRFAADVGVRDYHNHDWRTACFTWGESKGWSVDVLDACLSHKKGGIRKVYGLYSYLSEKREYLREWEGYIKSLKPVTIDPVI